MKAIGKNDELLTYMYLKDIYLISSVLNRIDVFNNNTGLSVEMYFAISSGTQIKLRFTDIKEYSFYYKDFNYFYNISYCKFFMENDVVYISLDPFDETEEMNESDQDFIICNNVEGFIDVLED